MVIISSGTFDDGINEIKRINEMKRDFNEWS
jgi:hypothetical protein